MTQLNIPPNITDMIQREAVQIVDLRFIDFPGVWQHFSVPATSFDEDAFKQGIGFDGSSIRCWQSIDESDMLVKPIAQSAFIDPFFEVKTLAILCDICDPVTGKDYSRDPRYVARKAERYLKSSGVGDVVYLGPEAEFFVLDDARFGQNERAGFYYLDSIEGCWNSGREENLDESGYSHNLAYKPRHKEGYFPCPPTDTLQDIRSKMALTLEEIGIPVEAQHHEVAAGGQCEIDMRFDSLVNMADKLLIYKYVVKNVARAHNKTVTFMPKPIFNDNGSGMHCHLSIWKNGKNLFAGKEYAGLSKTALYAIGGILKHASALLAFTNPSTNSYKRLVPGFEAPVNLAYSNRNRSAAIRIPMYSNAPKAKRIEFRCPDASCNPYFALSALTMAAADGILNRIDPGKPLDKDIYELSPRELGSVPQTPHSLEGALRALEEDHEFLVKNHVFTKDVIETWIAYKREQEITPVNLRPHPWEFAMYFDI